MSLKRPPSQPSGVSSRHSSAISRWRWQVQFRGRHMRRRSASEHDVATVLSALAHQHRGNAVLPVQRQAHRDPKVTSSSTKRWCLHLPACAAVQVWAKLSGMPDAW